MPSLLPACIPKNGLEQTLEGHWVSPSVPYLSLLCAKCHQILQPFLLATFSRTLRIFVPFLAHIMHCWSSLEIPTGCSLCCQLQIQFTGRAAE